MDPKDTLSYSGHSKSEVLVTVTEGNPVVEKALEVGFE